MILAFADDSSVCVFETVAQANSYCEAIDVENQVYVFLDERGFVLRPVFTKRPEKKRFLFITTVGEGAFSFERSGERREDLLRKLESGEITIERGPTPIHSLPDLREAAPILFAQ